MVLAVDIGNSNICIGGLTGAEHFSIQFTMRMVTRPRCTADEYAAEMKFLLRRLQVDPAACEGVIVCSVVPQLTEVLAAACKRLTGQEPLIVSCGLDTGLSFQVDEPAKVGRDRIADAAAAAAHYPLPCIWAPPRPTMSSLHSGRFWAASSYPVCRPVCGPSARARHSCPPLHPSRRSI